MSLALIAVVVLAALSVGYRVYGSFIARQFALDPGARTPAVSENDGVDFVPTPPFYLLGQHFSAIAAAGPIAGPILACQQFGWLPCLLWIGLGSVLIGAVHDFSTLVASVRHRARGVAEIIRQELGQRAFLAMMTFIWVALVYVIVAFADITAATFVGRTEDLEGLRTPFNQGGAVALASLLYLLLSIVMGLVERRFGPPLWLSTVIFVPATLGAIWVGTRYSTLLLWDAATWGVLILAYCFVASLVPVWALLQPRGYLGGFVLYMSLAVGLLGMFFGGFPVQQEAFKTWQAPGATGALFPFLFVTIACGACSGFHGLVCSGTTSKQIAREPHCRPVGYGAMLLEALVALIALSTVMIAGASELSGKGPGLIYGAGLGRYLTLAIGERHALFATTFGALAFSTFVFDTLDVSTRLGRYLLQELLGAHGTRRRAARHGADRGRAARVPARGRAGRLSRVLGAVRHLEPVVGGAVAAGHRRLVATHGTQRLVGAPAHGFRADDDLLVAAAPGTHGARVRHAGRTARAGGHQRSRGAAPARAGARAGGRGGTRDETSRARLKRAPGNRAALARRPVPLRAACYQVQPYAAMACFVASWACLQAVARPARPSGVDAACFQLALLASSCWRTMPRAASGTLLSMQARYLLRYSSHSGTPNSLPALLVALAGAATGAAWLALPVASFLSPPHAARPNVNAPATIANAIRLFMLCSLGGAFDGVAASGHDACETVTRRTPATALSPRRPPRTGERGAQARDVTTGRHFGRARRDRRPPIRPRPWSRRRTTPRPRRCRRRPRHAGPPRRRGARSPGSPRGHGA